jgi:nicotinate-nucleotide adenylyltransferase
VSSPGAQRPFPEVSGRKSRKIGLFGGTFDPPHVGHLVTAVNVRHALDLDVVVLMVANVPWQKQGSRAITPADDRFAMVQAAVAEVAGLEAGDLEIRRGGASYTADTLAALAEEHPDADLYTVVGDDAAAGITTWERYDEVAARSTLVVVDRPGAPVELPEQFPWVRVEVPRLEVSSTDLRARVSDGRPLDYLVTEPVLQIIRDRQLYRSADSAGGGSGTAGALGTSDVSGAAPVPASPALRGPESLEEVR